MLIQGRQKWKPLLFLIDIFKLLYQNYKTTQNQLTIQETTFNHTM